MRPAVNPLSARSLEDNVDINVNGHVGPDDDKKFIDINKKPKDSEEEDTFTIAGKDVTGRNMAQMSYEKMEKNILDSYAVLSDPEDKKIFYSYFLTNLKLYFDKFESEIEVDVAEPEVGNDNKPEEMSSQEEMPGL